jgi:NTP pyrophosphatase (non-canonical NTP hydrolase)
MVAAPRIDMRCIPYIDKFLDHGVPVRVQQYPELLDHVRVEKIQEEAGEAIAALIGMYGLNPRKGVTNTKDDVLKELADVVITALCAMQHFTKNTQLTAHIVNERLMFIWNRLDPIGVQHAPTQWNIE